MEGSDWPWEEEGGLQADGKRAHWRGPHGLTMAFGGGMPAVPLPMPTSAPSGVRATGVQRAPMTAPRQPSAATARRGSTRCTTAAGFTWHEPATAQPVQPSPQSLPPRPGPQQGAPMTAPQQPSAATGVDPWRQQGRANGASSSIFTWHAPAPSQPVQPTAQPPLAPGPQCFPPGPAPQQAQPSAPARSLPHAQYFRPNRQQSPFFANAATVGPATSLHPNSPAFTNFQQQPKQLYQQQPYHQCVPPHAGAAAPGQHVRTADSFSDGATGQTYAGAVGGAHCFSPGVARNGAASDSRADICGGVPPHTPQQSGPASGAGVPAGMHMPPTQQFASPGFAQCGATRSPNTRTAGRPVPANVEAANHRGGSPTVGAPKNTENQAADGDKRRTPEAARTASNLDVTLLPDGFPVGPISGERKDMRREVNRFTNNFNTGHGGFGCTYASQLQFKKTTGDRQRLVCDQHLKCGCKWSATYEETTMGWVLVSYVVHNEGTDAKGKKIGRTENQHSHELTCSQAERMCTREGKDIPEELRVLAYQMATSCSVALIDKTLIANAAEIGLPVTWDYDFLRNNLQERRAPSGVAIGSSMLESLQRRREASGLQYFVAADSDTDEVDRVWVEVKGGFQTWAGGGNSNVVLFDPTWGTNREGFKLCMFITVGSTGASECIALCLLRSETVDMFEWAFRCFAQVFKVAPACIFTDGDPKIAQAVGNLTASPILVIGCEVANPPWQGTLHFLCVYHLSQNFFEHIRKLFGSDLEGWRTAMGLFWKIAKDSDEQAQSTFDEDWKVLSDLVSGTGDSPGLEAELKWLDDLKKRAPQFCARYVWSVITWGIHSTQRSESMNGKVKSWLVVKNDMKKLLELIDLHNEVARDRKTVQQALLREKQLATLVDQVGS